MVFTPGLTPDLAERIRTPDCREDGPTAHDVFISYAHRDATKAATVCSALEQDGVPCWMAPRDVPPGTPYAQALVDAITASKVLVLLFSPAANRSEAVLNELELAFNRGKPILPIRLEAIEPTGSAEYYLRRRQWFDANTGLASRVTDIAAAVRDAIAATAAPAKRTRRLPRTVDEDHEDGGLIAARDGEQLAIAQLLKRARSGYGGLILVTGEPGIGKTRILQAALHDARAAGFRTASVSNFEHTRTPLGPWIDVLRALEPLLPELVPADPGDRSAYQRLLGVIDSGGPAPDGRRLLVIVTEALQRASKRAPLFIALDDAQWSDPESIELLDLIAPRLVAARIAIVVGRRSAESGVTSLALSRLERYPAVQTMPLEPLPDSAISQLIATLAPRGGVMSSSTIEEICRRSEGNPLFAAELVRDAKAGDKAGLLPESVQLTVVNRLAALAPDDVRIVETAAVIGRIFALEDLANVAQADRQAVIRALHGARNAALIRDAGSGTFAFRHELLRTAVYENTFSAERAEIHRSFAKLLAARPEAPAALLAYHWNRAGDIEQATRYAVQAGDEAMAINAYASARDNYGDALSGGALVGIDAATVEEKAATAYDALGAADDAAKHFFAAASSFRAAGEAQRAARLDLRFAANAYRAGRASEVERVCERVLAESTDREVLYGAHAILASFYSTRVDPGRVREHIEAADAMGVEGQVRDALSIAWASASIAEQPDGWLAPARRAVELSEARGSPALHALNLVNFAMLARWHGQDDAERAVAITRAIEIADRNGATYTAAYARCEHALALYFRGELNAAYGVLLEAVALHVEAVVVRIFVASVGLFILADLGVTDRFPIFRDPALLEAAFATGEPGRFAALAAAHVHAGVMSGETPSIVPIIKRALELIGSFNGVSRSLVTFALHGDADDRSKIAAMLPASAHQPPEELDRVMIAAITAVRSGAPAAVEHARSAAGAAHAADAPLFEALAYELLGRPDDAFVIYERIGARGLLRRLAKPPTARRRAASRLSAS